MLYSAINYVAPFPPITNITWRATDSILTVTWSPVAPDCPTIHYNIAASNCGSCPTTTNQTTVTCTDVPTNNSMCTLAVQVVVCGNISGNFSVIKQERISIDVDDTYNYNTSTGGASKDTTTLRGISEPSLSTQPKFILEMIHVPDLAVVIIIDEIISSYSKKKKKWIVQISKELICIDNLPEFSLGIIVHVTDLYAQ